MHKNNVLLALVPRSRRILGRISVGVLNPTHSWLWWGGRRICGIGRRNYGIWIRGDFCSLIHLFDVLQVEPDARTLTNLLSIGGELGVEFAVPFSNPFEQ